MFFNYKPTKREIEKRKKIERGIQESLEYFQNKLNEEKVQKEIEANTELYRNAKKQYAEQIRRRRELLIENHNINTFRENMIQELIEDQIVELVLQSLLLDEEYFEKNPDYLKTIKETVSTILEVAPINEDIEDEDANSIIDFIAYSTPWYNKEILNEAEEIKNNIKKNSEEKIAQAMKKLSKKVIKEVTKTIDDEINKANEIENEIAAIMKESNDNVLYRERQLNGLLETIAVADAKQQIEKYGDYDRDLAISNAILMLTIFESVNAMGVVTIDESFKREYVRLLNR